MKRTTNFWEHSEFYRRSRKGRHATSKAALPDPEPEYLTCCHCNSKWLKESLVPEDYMDHVKACLANHISALRSNGLVKFADKTYPLATPIITPALQAEREEKKAFDSGFISVGIMRYLGK